MQKYRKSEHLNLVSENLEEETEVEPLYADVGLQTLLKYIQELPNKYRLTFNLYVLDGFTHKEISEQLGTSPGTSKSNLARARMILKERIEREQNKAVIGLLIFFTKEDECSMKKNIKIKT